jgi:hypothetical protein
MGIAQDIDECYLGVHNCGKYGICTNTLGSFECTARLGTSAGGITLPLQDSGNMESVSVGGDVNLDGIRDMAMGAPNSCAVYILFMETSGTSARSFATITSSTPRFTTVSGQNFGFSVSVGGDLNYDGSVDLAVGAHTYSAEGANRGAAYIIFLDGAGAVQNFVRISSSSFTGSLRDNDFFGLGVSLSVDLNSDGVLDLVVGADSDDDGGTNAGAAYIFFLQTWGAYKSFKKISGIAGSVLNGGNGLTGGQNFGHDVSIDNGSDMNGDGIPDLGAGTVGANAVYIVFLKRDGAAVSYTKIATGLAGFTYTTTGTYFGSAIQLGADLNGDSHPDAIVGAVVSEEGGGSVVGFNNALRLRAHSITSAISLHLLGCSKTSSVLRFPDR